MKDSHLHAVRKRIRRKIDNLEGDAELAEEGSPLWNYIQSEIESYKKHLFKLEFMVYSGGEQCEAQ